LQSQSWCPTQQGHPVGFLRKVRWDARACQLCTLPLGHSWQHHQINLLLCNVVLSGKFPFSQFLS